MIKFENTRIAGFEPAIRGLRNPKNSWDRSDSTFFDDDINGVASIINKRDMCAPLELLQIGINDSKLMTALDKAGPVHAKYRRQLIVWVDITAPLYFWKEFDTYKVGTVSDSCSTMHKIQEKKFTIDDFSAEHLFKENDELATPEYYERRSPVFSPCSTMEILINALNNCREKFLETGDKVWWWQMIQLLPSSYNQKRTIMLSYEVLTAMYQYRDGHKLDEWCDLRKWIETLPESWIITCEEEANKAQDVEIMVNTDNTCNIYISKKDYASITFSGEDGPAKVFVQLTSDEEKHIGEVETCFYETNTG